MRAFVTGTGTEIGKTFLTCLLLRYLGAGAVGLKPVVSGFDMDRPEGSDPALLLEASGRAVDAAAIGAIAPFRFAAPLSPEMAAAAEARVLDYAALIAFCQAASGRPGGLLVEGVGGVMVPLDGRHTVLDWMAELALPVILVGGSYLGALSHTLSAIEVMRGRGLRLAVAVVNETPAPSVGMAATVDAVARHGGVPVVGLPRCIGQPDHDALAARIAALVGDASRWS